MNREKRQEAARIRELRGLLDQVGRLEFWGQLSKAQDSRGQGPDSFQRAIERRAQALRLTPEELLSGYAQQLRESNYPTPDCLEPDEVQMLVAGGAPTSDQAAHVQACEPCRKLFEASSVTPDAMQELLGKIQQAATQAEVGGERKVAARAAGGGRSFQESRGLSAAYLGLREKLAAGVLAWRLGLAGGASAVLIVVVLLSLVILKPFSTPAPVTSMALLPLENASGNPGEQYLAAAMTYELISSLGTVGELRVTSLESSMAFAGSDRPIPEIAKALQVQAVARGSLRREKDQIVVSAVLFDADTNKVLWTETYEKAFGDALTLRNQMTRAFATHVGVRLTGEEEARLNRDFAVAPAALDAYFQGQYLLNKRKETDLQKAITHFGQAIDVEPNLGLAYVGLADCYNLSVLGYSRLFAVEDAYQKAMQNAQDALKLDKTLAGAHAAIALSKMWYERDWVGAEQEFKQALTLNPSHAPARHWFGLYLGLMGRTSEAILELTRAIELDPLSPRFYGALGDVYYLARDYEKAVSQYEKALAIERNYEAARVNLAMALVHRGNYEKAISIFETANEKPSLARAYAASGDRQKARRILAQLATAKAAEPYSSFEIAVAYATLGDKDDAFRSLENAFRRRDPGLMQLRVSPDVDPLRSDPRFRVMLRRMNFLK